MVFELFLIIRKDIVISKFNFNFHSQCELSWATYFVLCLRKKNETLNGNYIFYTYISCNRKPEKPLSKIWIIVSLSVWVFVCLFLFSFFCIHCKPILCLSLSHVENVSRACHVLLLPPKRKILNSKNNHFMPN
jgi:hypothetical protein